MRKIVKTTTVGSLKNKLNESKGNFALGQGFGSEPRFKSNVQSNSDYSRKLDKNGGFGLGDGFTKLNEEEMVDFIANIVESMKGKTEYHNLKFVDRIGNENGLFESQIKNIKNIIKSDRTPYQLKLRKYLTENVAEEMSEIYEGYSGLMHESEMMVNEIKSTFNEMKSMGKSTNEAVAMTAEALDVPMEMVGKMVEVQKEAYKARMEGMGETMNINEKLCEVYEAYKNMAEGNMKPVYEELKEMMNPEPIEPEESKESEYGEYGDWGTEEEYGEYLRGSEGGDDGTDYQISRGKEDDYYLNNLEEDLCMECDDMDDESYIEVELSSPKDFALLPMLAKGAMSAGRMPSMGMSKMSRAMNSPVKDYEVPDYSTSNPYSQYRFDTGLSKIPYGKKKFMSDEGGEDSLTITNEEFVRIFKNKPVVKMSACKKYIMIENTIYSTKTGKKISNTLLIENLLVEAWNLLDYAQAIVSVVSIFLPFVGNGTLFVNGIIYLYRGYTTKDDPNASSERIFNGILDLISAILPQVLGPACQYIKGALKLGTIGTRVINSIKIILNGLAEFGGTVIKAFGKFVGLRLVRAIIGKANAEAFEIWLRAAYESVKKRLQGFLAKNAGKAGAEGAEAAAKALTKAEILATKEGFETFFTKGVVKVAPKQASELLAKLNFKVGQTVTHKGKTWIINTISPKTNLVTLKDVAGKGFENVGATDFVNQVVKSPWFKSWATKKLANASAYAAKYNTIGKGASFLGVRFLAGFTFGADGNATIDMSKIPDGEYPDMSAANVDVEFEGGEYGGDTGQYTANDQVTAVQTALQALGENLGGAGVDGKYGPDTRGAINAVEDKVGVPKTTGNITFKSVIAIIIALVQKGKIAEAKELAAAIQDSEIKNNVDMILNSSTFTNPIKMGMLKALVSGKKPSTEKTSFMPDFMKNITGASTVAEETFSESYKRMFGLTLD